MGREVKKDVKRRPCDLVGRNESISTDDSDWLSPKNLAMVGLLVAEEGREHLAVLEWRSYTTLPAGR